MYNSDTPTRAELPTTRQLLRSTFIALVTAAVLLVTVVLPAEYGIDPTGMGRLLQLTEMGNVKQQLADEAEADRVKDQKRKSAVSEPEKQSSLLKIIASVFVTPAAAEPAPSPAVRKDETTLTLKPGEGAEIKMQMRKGAKANYSWTVAGGVVNFDEHGDGGNDNSTSYEKGRAVSNKEGVLEAAFDGFHGWFWRNRGGADVTVSLSTNGEYDVIKRME